MFFLISKLMVWVLQPMTVVLLGLLFALLCLRRGRMRLGKRLVTASLGLVVIGGYLPMGTALILPLEERFKQVELPPDADVKGIIVLGGAEEANISTARGVPSLNEAGERMTEAMSLAHRYPRARVVFTGGATEIVATPVFGADSAELFFRGQGLDMRRLTLERRSRNTYENAVNTHALVAPRPGELWVLVTSAFHMPRAMGTFRKVDWRVQPWPVDYRTEGWGDLVHPVSNPTAGFRQLEVAAKEWVGLIAYRLTGRTAELFPAPAPSR